MKYFLIIGFVIFQSVNLIAQDEILIGGYVVVFDTKGLDYKSIGNYETVTNMINKEKVSFEGHGILHFTDDYIEVKVFKNDTYNPIINQKWKFTTSGEYGRYSEFMDINRHFSFSGAFTPLENLVGNSVSLINYANAMKNEPGDLFVFTIDNSSLVYCFFSLERKTFSNELKWLYWYKIIHEKKQKNED